MFRDDVRCKSSRLTRSELRLREIQTSVDAIRPRSIVPMKRTLQAIPRDQESCCHNLPFAMNATEEEYNRIQPYLMAMLNES